MINFLKLNHIQICVPKDKEKEAKYFYSKVLGLTEIEKPDILKPRGGFWYKIADIQLHIGFEDTIKSKRHPAFEVENIQEVRKYLENHQVEIRDEIEIPNVIRFSIFDPFNNRIELIENI